MEKISKSMLVCIKQRVVLEIMGTKMYIRSKQNWLPFSFGWKNKVCPSETTHTVRIDLFSVSRYYCSHRSLQSFLALQLLLSHNLVSNGLVWQRFLLTKLCIRLPLTLTIPTALLPLKLRPSSPWRNAGPCPPQLLIIIIIINNPYLYLGLCSSKCFPHLLSCLTFIMTVLGRMQGRCYPGI